MLKDNFNRIISYCRISLTDRCPLRCRYCMPVYGVLKLNHKEILSYEEILKIVEILKKLGVKKFRFTGGEPLIRKNVFDFFESLPEYDNYHLTTSLAVKDLVVDRLNKLNFESINISLDTIQPEKYKYITRVGDLNVILENLKNLKCKRIKFNTVIIKNFNDDEIIDLIEFAQKYNADIRFIEKMSIYNDDLQFLSLSQIKKILLSNGIIEPYGIQEENSIAIYHKFKNGNIKVGFITPISCSFCITCNRIRIKADGDVKLCLFSNNSYNIKEVLKESNSDYAIMEWFRKIITFKPEKMNILRDGSMASIGG